MLLLLNKLVVSPMSLIHIKHAFGVQCLSKALEQLFTRLIKVFDFIHDSIALLNDDGTVFKECHACARVFRQPEVTFDNMLEETIGRFLQLACDHVVEDGAHCKEPLGSLTQVRKPVFI